MSVAGRVVQLWRHPVKSLQGERLHHTVVTGRGVVGDREWGVRDCGTGTLLSAKRHPALLLAGAAAAGEGVAVTVPGAPVSTGTAAEARLSALLGRPVRLDRAPEVGPAFVDAADLHLLTLRDLGGWDVRRFRPNVVLDTDLVLDELAGERVTLGGVVVEVGKPTKRCAMTTAAQPGLGKDVDVLRTLARQRGVCLGVYARVVRPGALAEGDGFGA